MTPTEKSCFQEEKAKAVLDAYKKGFRHALQAFAVWNDGIEIVGCGMMTLTDAIEKMETIYTYSPPRI
jgi:hypothetical protein